MTIHVYYYPDDMSIDVDRTVCGIPRNRMGPIYGRFKDRAFHSTLNFLAETNDAKCRTCLASLDPLEVLAALAI